MLLSGGLDSATALAIARADGHTCRTLSFDYGQRHRHELSAAAALSTSLGAVSHGVVRVDASTFGTSHSLSTFESAAPVPKRREPEDMAHDSIPSTYVPARNTLFLAYATAAAEAASARAIYIGANAIDYSGYPDCRPVFLEAFQRVVDTGTKSGVEGRRIIVHAPLLHWDKKEIIRRGLDLGVDFSKTHSCYDPGPNGRPCEVCDSCVLRARAFAELGFPVDPVVQRFREKEEEEAEAEQGQRKVK